MKNLTGRVFSSWSVLELAETRNKRRYWACLCLCGRKRKVLQYALTSGKSKSCGCRGGEDLSQQRFGNLIAVAPVIRGDGVKVWRCICTCGNEALVRSQTLKEGKESCGCIKKKLYWKLVPSSNPEDFSTEEVEAFKRSRRL
jgi:hypothetical protein